MLQYKIKNYLKLINEAFGKISLCRNISVYKLSKEELCKLEIFDINPKNELQNVKNKEVMYKLNLQEGTPILYYSNIIFYENFNKTLPLGMNLSTQILLDIDKLEFELIKESEFNINIQKNQFDFEIKKVKVKEYNVKGKNKEWYGEYMLKILYRGKIIVDFSYTIYNKKKENSLLNFLSFY